MLQTLTFPMVLLSKQVIRNVKDEPKMHFSTILVCTGRVALGLILSNSIIEEVIFFFSLIFSFTLLLSSLVAVCSQDIKKVVALSTLSQLSFMILTLSLGIPVLAFFHLLTHAMFKSCLFLKLQRMSLISWPLSNAGSSLLEALVSPSQ